MGREVRRVPPNWEHPKDERDRYIPMFDEDYETAAAKWLAECIRWAYGTHEMLIDHPERKRESPFYWEYEGEPPNRDSYRPKFDTEPTWYQVYETVSEGTPVTPPFATKEEVVDYLVEHGTFWDEKRGEGGWKRENAESFVNAGWAPSMIVEVNNGAATIKTARDGCMNIVDKAKDDTIKPKE